jgi:transcriptional regulator GlxA family with amidase domain
MAVRDGSVVDLRPRPHRVAVLAVDDVVAFELGIPSRIFGSAKDADGTPRYEVRTCTPDGGPVRTTADFNVVPGHGPEILPWADTLVIPGLHGGAALDGGPLEPPLAAALDLLRHGTRLLSICTGSFVLATAGLLDGRPATTHWRHTDSFRRLFPRVRLDPDVLFVDDGDVLTSAGVAAGIDLCLHVVRRDFGSEVANRAARACVVPPWRDGGQSQFIERPLPEPRDTSTAATREWALRRLGEPAERLDLRAMADHARMSVRTFTRRFRDETGTSPARWLLAQRVERARHLLETTDLTVDRIAREAGFGTAVSLRQHLHATLGVSPSGYRRTFRPSA